MPITYNIGIKELVEAMPPATCPDCGADSAAAEWIADEVPKNDIGPADFDDQGDRQEPWEPDGGVLAGASARLTALLAKFWCGQCGEGVKADEDGCCTSCGLDTIRPVVLSQIFEAALGQPADPRERPISPKPEDKLADAIRAARTDLQEIRQ